jgi:hypothetical protein
MSALTGVVGFHARVKGMDCFVWTFVYIFNHVMCHFLKAGASVAGKVHLNVKIFNSRYNRGMLSAQSY